MAGKIDKKAHDNEAAQEVYELAQADAKRQMEELRDQMEAVRQESYVMGAVKAFDANIAQNEFLKIMALYRIKQAKDYKAGGMTWAQFCDAVGVAQRSADRMIEEARPLFESFSANVAEIAGMPFNQIRMLGKAVSANLAEIENNCLVYGDESIPLTPDHVDDIQALIERIGEEAKAAKHDAEASIRAKDKVLKSKEDVIKKQEKDLARFEREVKARGLTPEEASLMDKIAAMEVVFSGHCLQMDTLLKALRENPATDAVAGAIAMLDNVRMRVSAYREEVVAELAPSGMLPDEDWQPTIAG